MTEPLDPVRFAELEDDFGPDLQAMVEQFLDVTPPLVDELATTDDRHRAASVAHKLRGGCLTVGAIPLADAAADVERAARDGELDAEAIAECVRWWGETRQALLLRIA